MKRNPNQDITFLHEKIKTIGCALFYPENKNLFRYPVSVAKAIHIGEDGSLQFLINQPWASHNAWQLNFPLDMTLARKGIKFALHIHGTGRLQPFAEKNCGPQKRYPKDLLLVKVKMDSAEYFDYTEQPPLGFLAKWKESLKKLLFILKPQQTCFSFQQ